MIWARCCGASVRSAIMACDPVMEEAGPAPTRRRHARTGARPLCMKSPVPAEPAAVISVPYCMSGLRPSVSHSLPRGRFSASRADDEAAISAPIPVAPRFISAAKMGSTGTTWLTPALSMICEPTRVPT